MRGRRICLRFFGNEPCLLYTSLEIYERHKSENLEEFMGGFVDIHCHLIPGVDDGAKDIDVYKRQEL